MTVSADLDDRFLKVLPNLTDWAKHLITISSAILLLSAGLLRDVLVNVDISWRIAIASLLTACYLGLLLAIWFALEFMARASSSVLTMSDSIVNSEELEIPAEPFNRAQRAFRCGIVSFAILAVVVLSNWLFG